MELIEKNKNIIEEKNSENILINKDEIKINI